MIRCTYSREYVSFAVNKTSMQSRLNLDSDDRVLGLSLDLSNPYPTLVTLALLERWDA